MICKDTIEDKFYNYRNGNVSLQKNLFLMTNVRKSLSKKMWNIYQLAFYDVIKSFSL